jgi:predicted lipoprotein with Yx(FWY)xxD motif
MRLSKVRITTLLLALGAAAVITTVAIGSVRKQHVATTAKNAKLGEILVVNTKGRTLYWLSNETKAHLKCTGKCLSFWPPLYVAAGTTPTGVTGLGTFKRSDNKKTQVTFHGYPIYTFSGDTAAGQTGGNGFKDGAGVWHAGSTGKFAAPTTTTTQTTTTTPTTTSSGGGGGGGGGYGAGGGY